MFPTEGAAMAWTTLNGNGDNANDNVGGGNGATSLVLGRGLYALANKCRRHLRVVWEIWPCVLHRCDLARSACSLSLVLGFLRQHGGGSSALGEPGQIWYESIRGAGAIDICQSPPLPPVPARGVRKVSVARESTSDGAKGYPQWLRKAAPPALVREQAVP